MAEMRHLQAELDTLKPTITYAIVNPFEPNQPLSIISGTVPVDRFASFLAQATVSFQEAKLAANE